MLDRRLQVLVDGDRYRRLEAEALRRKVSVAVVVREAIDAAYPVTSAERRAAASAILGVPTMDVPEPGDLREELNALRGRRG